MNEGMGFTGHSKVLMEDTKSNNMAQVLLEENVLSTEIIGYMVESEFHQTERSVRPVDQVRQLFSSLR